MTPTPSCSWLDRQEKLRIAALSCVKRWEHCVEVAGVQVVLIRALPFCQVPHDTLDTRRISQFYRSPVHLWVSSRRVCWASLLRFYANQTFMSCLVQLTRHTRLMHETPGFFAGLDTLDSHLPRREQEPQELGLIGATGQVLIRLAGSCRVAQRSPFH